MRYILLAAILPLAACAAPEADFPRLADLAHPDRALATPRDEADARIARLKAEGAGALREGAELGRAVGIGQPR